jgi:hypothetical protein
MGFFNNPFIDHFLVVANRVTAQSDVRNLAIPDPFKNALVANAKLLRQVFSV